MGDTIKARKGIKASIDPLLLGEFGFTTDEERLYIGGNNGNIPLPNAADLSEKMQLYIAETLPAIADRKEKTMYLKITDTINNGTTDNIQVSPTMGIKIV